MRTNTPTSLVAILASAVLLAACSGNEPGIPVPSGQPGTQPPTATSQPGASLPHSGAPKVTSPIADTSKWEADPCSVISEEQLSSAGFKIRRFEPDLEDAAGPVCSWAIEEVGSFGAGFATVNPEGLSTVYASNTAGKFGVFTALSPIEGHPAVRAEKSDESSEGMCSVTVGIRDDLNFDVVVTFDAGTKDPCKAAQDIAALAVQTMKGGA